MKIKLKAKDFRINSAISLFSQYCAVYNCPVSRASRRTLNTEVTCGEHYIRVGGVIHPMSNGYEYKQFKKDKFLSSFLPGFVTIRTVEVPSL